MISIKNSIIIFGITAALFLLVMAGSATAQNWENLPGHARAIAVGGDSTDVVYAIGRDNSAYKWDESSFTWQTLGGSGQLLTVGTDGIPWMVNNGQIYRLRGQVWQQIPGRANAIGAGGGEVWIIGGSGSVYKWSEDAFSWQDYGGKASVLTVGNDGIPWVINDRQIYRLRGQVWQNMPGQASDIGAGGGEVWTVGNNNAVYRWNEDAFSWANVGGEVHTVDAGPTGTPYAVQRTGTQVYRLRGWQ